MPGISGPALHESLRAAIGTFWTFMSILLAGLLVLLVLIPGLTVPEEVLAMSLGIGRPNQVASVLLALCLAAPIATARMATADYHRVLSAIPSMTLLLTLGASIYSDPASSLLLYGLFFAVVITILLDRAATPGDCSPESEDGPVLDDMPEWVNMLLDDLPAQDRESYGEKMVSSLERLQAELQ